jgi:amidase
MFCLVVRLGTFPMVQLLSPTNEFGAFCFGARVELPGSSPGPLRGLKFAAKDNFDVAGFVTGAGSPDWKETHAPPRFTAQSIRQLLAAGASLVGKTQMDQLAYGTLGVNEHYGTPRNPATPGRIPGGSSSGPACAVAGHEVDFALGTDSACSVRLPAALCGIYGIRPTHGRISLHGVVPLSPSLDTIGWFTRTPDLLVSVGGVLLDPKDATAGTISRVYVADDALALAQPRVVAALQPAISKVAALINSREMISIADAAAPEGLDWFWFRVWSVQVREVWTEHGAWIEATHPRSRALSRKNLETGAESTPEEIDEDVPWAALRTLVRKRIGENGVICIPTTSDIAPRLGVESDLASFTRPTLCLMSIAGVAGLPQVTLPLAQVEDCPVGLSLIGPPGSDEQLINLALHLNSSGR